MIAIIKYNAGNIRSVKNAVNRLGFDVEITDDATKIRDAQKVIFPGVGEAKSAMEYLREKKLDNVIKELKQPVLGICLGLQLLCSHSEERNTNGLGIFENSVKKFTTQDIVPHMGWNSLTGLKGPLFKNIEEFNDVYFVHSYYADVNRYTTALCIYDHPFSAALQKNNFYATQFHPEKSADVGEQILKNFLTL